MRPVQQGSLSRRRSGASIRMERLRLPNCPRPRLRLPSFYIAEHIAGLSCLTKLVNRQYYRGLSSRLTTPTIVSCAGYSVACSANVQVGEAHEHQPGSKQAGGDKTAKRKKKAKSKAGVGKNQRAVQKARPGQNTNKRVSTNHSVTEGNHMKQSNFSKNLLSKVRNWTTSAILAVMFANSSSPVL
jgi:hypothetical protein